MIDLQRFNCLQPILFFNWIYILTYIEGNHSFIHTHSNVYQSLSTIIFFSHWIRILTTLFLLYLLCTTLIALLSFSTLQFPCHPFRLLHDVHRLHAMHCLESTSMEVEVGNCSTVSINSEYFPGFYYEQVSVIFTDSETHWQLLSPIWK